MTAALRGAPLLPLLLLLSGVPAHPQSNRASRVGLDEQAELTKMVDDAVAGKPPGGDAWLKWMPHFLRGAEGRTYVPFTLSIEEAAGAFEHATVYVRVAPRGDDRRDGHREATVENALGVASGELPVSAPDRPLGRGAPTPAEASVMLRSLTAKPAPRGYPFEALYVIEPKPDPGDTIPRARRALDAPPGDYDVYIAVLERGRRADRRRWAVMKQQVSIPDLSRRGLRLSTPILARAVRELRTPVPQAEATARPYAFGTAELIPSADALFAADETVHVAILIYDAAADAHGKPDVRVEYRLYARAAASERLLGATPPQQLDAATLPSAFDLRAGAGLAAMQSLPLAPYAPGPYRLLVRVVDRLSGANVEESVLFVITGA